MKSCKEADVKVEFKQLKVGFAVIFQRFDKTVNFLRHVVIDKTTNINPDEVIL